MEREEIIKAWLESAERNITTARDLIRLKHYDWALFLGQLALEKLLKSVVTKAQNDSPPYTHNLVKLAELSNLKFSEEDLENLAQITKYNVQARYDDIKYQLYRMATIEYTEEWFTKIERIYSWIKQYC